MIKLRARDWVNYLSYQAVEQRLDPGPMPRQNPKSGKSSTLTDFSGVQAIEIFLIPAISDFGNETNWIYAFFESCNKKDNVRETGFASSPSCATKGPLIALVKF